MTVPSSLVVMVPSPSLSKSEKASLNSSCNKESWLFSEGKNKTKTTPVKQLATTGKTPQHHVTKPTFKTKLIIVLLNVHINQLRDTDATLLSSNYKFLAKQEQRPQGGAAEGKVVLHQRQMTAPCSFGGALRDDEQ